MNVFHRIRVSELERPTGPTSWSDWPLLAARGLGAVAVLVVGAVHLHEYLGLYSAIPTIGTLFLLNFAGATAIGVGLLAPLDHLVGRWSRAIVLLLAASGVVLAATAFVSLYISERTPLFGFMEPGYDPAGIRVAQASEVAAVVLLGSFLAGMFPRGSATRRW